MWLTTTGVVSKPDIFGHSSEFAEQLRRIEHQASKAKDLKNHLDKCVYGSCVRYFDAFVKGHPKKEKTKAKSSKLFRPTSKLCEFSPQK